MKRNEILALATCLVFYGLFVFQTVQSEKKDEQIMELKAALELEKSSKHEARSIAQDSINQAVDCMNSIVGEINQ